MNIELFEQLLYEEESTTLDFKKQQYRFIKASDDEKSELLKDILGFANAWRRSKAYILIGVEDVRGGRGNVVGIPETSHLDDHSLQQFVNNMTNQPVHFHYEAFGIDGKQIGIICIDEQTRPIYLKRNYGKLLKEKVFVRRGSSTDPSKPASLEEIAQMRPSSGQSDAEVIIEFANTERYESLGPKINWNAEFCEMPENIPDLAPPRQRNRYGVDLSAISYGLPNRLNTEYFRELANFIFVRRLFRPIRFVVTNVGQVAANSVRVELTVPTDIGVVVLGTSEIPDLPKRNADLFISPAIKGTKPAFRRNPGDVEIAKNNEQFCIEIDCGELQPGRQVWTDVFYIGKGECGDLSLCGTILAGNLPRPKDFTLTVSATVVKTIMTVKELVSLPEIDACDEQ